MVAELGRGGCATTVRVYSSFEESRIRELAKQFPKFKLDGVKDGRLAMEAYLEAIDPSTSEDRKEQIGKVFTAQKELAD